MKKKILIVTIYVFTVLFLLNHIRLCNAENSNLKVLNDYLKSTNSALKERVNAVSCANILMVNHMCKIDQKKMKRNKDYLNVIDELN